MNLGHQHKSFVQTSLPSNAHVFLQIPGERLSTVDIAKPVNRDEFRPVTAFNSRIAAWQEYERLNPSFAGIADSYAHFPARILYVVRFGI